MSARFALKWLCDDGVLVYSFFGLFLIYAAYNFIICVKDIDVVISF